MELSDWMEKMAESQMGLVFAFLLICFCALLGVYIYLSERQKRKDRLAYLHRRFYQETENLCDPFNFAGEHRAEIFGRTSTVLCKKRSYATCTIPPPVLIDQETLNRYRAFRRTNVSHLPLFAKHSWSFDDDRLVVVQDGLVKRDGQKMLHLQHFLDDRRLGRAYTEQILAQIAEAISALHNCQTEQGQILYHGFLLPRSIRIEFGVDRTLAKIVIADLGMAFSFGPQRVWEMEDGLRSGDLQVDRSVAKELLDQLSMLSPEQRDQGRLHQVGPASDFYAFAALACLLFTKRRFRASGAVNWSEVPKKWTPFLQKCLSDDPRCRPKDFLQLKDLLQNPALFLVPEESVEKVIVDSVQPLPAVKDVIDRLKNKQKKDFYTVDDFRQKADHAFQIGHWQEAKQYFLEVVKHQPLDGEIQVSLAITFYEMGDLERAEYHYCLAKNIDPKTAKCFKEHIAFRI